MLSIWAQIAPETTVSWGENEQDCQKKTMIFPENLNHTLQGKGVPRSKAGSFQTRPGDLVVPDPFGR